MNWKDISDQALVCFKNEISKEMITHAIMLGYDTVQLIGEYTTAGTHEECGSCTPNGEDCRLSIAEIIETYRPVPSEDSCCGRGCCF